MKIFITVGTSSFPFLRLIEEVLEIAKDKNFTGDSFLIQGTKKKEIKKNIKKIPFLSFKETKEAFKRADIIITHGGLASIFLSWKLNKKIPIVIPRLKKYKEHVNDHQLNFARFLQRNKKIILVEKIDNLKNILINYKKFNPKLTNFLEDEKEQKRLIQNLVFYTESLK